MEKAVICPHCGCQVEEIKGAFGAAQPNIVINNTNSNVNCNVNTIRGDGCEKNKWVAVPLCFFLGAIGGHKFYEGKIGMGILHLFTVEFFGLGVLVDFISLLLKPNPYYV